MGKMSTATMCVCSPRGIVRAAICVQPPGAAHRSSTIRDSCKNGNLRLICVNLKAARDRRPCSLATGNGQRGMNQVSKSVLGVLYYVLQNNSIITMSEFRIRGILLTVIVLVLIMMLLALIAIRWSLSHDYLAISLRCPRRNNNIFCELVGQRASGDGKRS